MNIDRSGNLIIAAIIGLIIIDIIGVAGGSMP